MQEFKNGVPSGPINYISTTEEGPQSKSKKKVKRVRQIIMLLG